MSHIYLFIVGRCRCRSLSLELLCAPDSDPSSKPEISCERPRHISLPKNKVIFPILDLVVFIVASHYGVLVVILVASSTDSYLPSRALRTILILTVHVLHPPPKKKKLLLEGKGRGLVSYLFIHPRQIDVGSCPSLLSFPLLLLTDSDLLLSVSHIPAKIFDPQSSIPKKEGRK